MMAKHSVTNRSSRSWHVAGPCRRTCPSTLLGLAVILAAGCGPSEPIAQLSGRVTFRGEPLPEGLIVLSNPTLGVYITANIVDGAYTVKTAKQGVPPGEYLVTITPPLVDHPVGPILERPRPAQYADIPERYRDEQTSGLTTRLEAGDNVVDFDMQN